MEHERDGSILSQASERQERHLDSDPFLEALASSTIQPRLGIKIAQVCSARTATYGAVASMMTLADELRSQGNEVQFLTFRGRGLGSYVQSKGYRNHAFRVRTKIDPIAIALMARHFRRSGTEIVHCHLSTSALNGSLAARLAGLPSVSTVHGMSGKLSYVASQRMIAVSGEVRRHLVNQGVHESRISIVPNGIRVPNWHEGLRLQARLHLGIPESTPLVGTTARLTKLKGLSHALSAIARVKQDYPDIKYIVFGEGEDRTELEAKSSLLGLKENVLWAGYRKDVQDLLPALDVFVFPSLREAMGLSVVEAMAARVPTIASRTGGIPEVLVEGTGVLTPPGDSVELADTILTLLRDPARRRALGEAARIRAVDEFSARKMAARTLEVYAAMLSR